MGVLDVFSVLAQVILMQIVMRTPASQIADLVWKPLKTEGPQLEIRDKTRKSKLTKKPNENMCL